MNHQANISSVIIESMSDGIIVLNFHGHITLMNPAAADLLGIKMEEIKSKTYFQLFMDEPGNDAFNDLLLQGIQNGETRLYGEVPFLRRDGRCLDLALTTSFLKADPADKDMAGIVVVFKNITESKALDRARRRVLNHLAHELRTPLSIILSSLKRLKTSGNERSIERIKRNLERLQDIQQEVEDIVKHCVFEEKPEKLSKTKLQDVDIGESIQRVVESAGRISSHRFVTLLTRIKGDFHTMIDPDVLDTVLMSLIKNAIENTPDGGEVMISLSHQAESVVLEIKDSGVGITEESQKQIFGGFYHSLETDLYSTRNPFDFGAGGKGLDLLRIKLFEEIYHFKVECESTRCRYIPRENDSCPGAIAKCLHVQNQERCAQSGGTAFKLVFPKV